VYNSKIEVDGNGNAYAIWCEIGDIYGVYFSFKAKDGAWGAKERVDDGDDYMPKFYPSIAIDKQGNAYAVWREKRNGVYQIFYSFKPSGGNWNANISIEQQGGPTKPSIKVDNEGNLYVVYQAYFGSSGIYFRYKPLNGSWSNRIRIDDGFISASSPSLAVDALGNAYSVWADYRNGDADIYFSYRPAGGNWSSNSRVDDSPVGTDSNYPSIAVDETGNAHAVWFDKKPSAVGIYYSYRLPNGTWQQSQKIDDNIPAAADVPWLDIDNSNNIYAVWTDSREGNYEIYFSKKLSGGNWEPNVKVNDVNSYWVDCPHIAVDNNGNAYAIWYDINLYDWIWNIRSSYLPAGGVWSPSEQVNDIDDSGSHDDWYPIGPSIAVDNNTNAYAVWNDARIGTPANFSMKPFGGSWSSNTSINDYGEVYNPSIVVDKDGNSYAVWQDYRSGNSHIYFSFRPAGGTWLPSERVDDAPETSYASDPQISIDNSGNASVIWSDSRTGFSKIYLSSKALGGNWQPSIRVDDSPKACSAYYPMVARDDLGNMFATWQEDCQGYPQSHIAYRSAAGIFGKSMLLNKEGSAARYPRISINDLGNIYALWIDYRNENLSQLFGSTIPYLIIPNKLNIEEVIGNNNGVLEPYETVIIKPSWENSGNKDILSVAGSITSNEPVNIID